MFFILAKLRAHTSPCPGNLGAIGQVSLHKETEIPEMHLHLLLNSLAGFHHINLQGSFNKPFPTTNTLKFCNFFLNSVLGDLRRLNS